LFFHNTFTISNIYKTIQQLINSIFGYRFLLSFRTISFRAEDEKSRSGGKNLTIDKKAARMRAEDFMRQGLGPADAAHLTSAEASKADFINCDDKLIKKCFKVNLKI
jgi:hypothetical protein